MTPIKVAVALLLKDGCVLMGERKPHKVYPLHWEFPGGKLEDGESHFDALQRELSEELGIDIAEAEEWMSEVATYSNGMTYDIRYFLVRSWQAEIDNREFNQILWVSNKTLPTLLHLSGNKNILERLYTDGIPS
jgi:8-oxo-dGTP diphosphatase